MEIKRRLPPPPPPPAPTRTQTFSYTTITIMIPSLIASYNNGTREARIGQVQITNSRLVLENSHDSPVGAPPPSSLQVSSLKDVGSKGPHCQRWTTHGAEKPSSFITRDW